ncbi:hypothetical protein [Erythrobacter ani]|uniref:SRPBCC family protein n=1 Tax=Erythrobacter ani TaxID=2827235 RepID=A0ABS6SM08_9SPHN|nr:hypothetical protein [Erythrobacter ani]MBV7265532.1 hypothetical protein [Erythrobacter ani]
MATTVELTTYIDASSDEVLRRVMTPRLLDHVASPMLTFDYPAAFERGGDWPMGEHRVRMKLFGVVPIGWQIIGIEIPESPDADTHILRDNGYGPLITRWDHWIVIRPDPSGEGTRYTDRVHIAAGLLTPIIAAYARIFYTHRQNRWRELAHSNFAALET